MEMRAWRAAARSIVTLPASAPATPPSTGAASLRRLPEPLKRLTEARRWSPQGDADGCGGGTNDRIVDAGLARALRDVERVEGALCEERHVGPGGLEGRPPAETWHAFGEQAAGHLLRRRPRARGHPGWSHASRGKLQGVVEVHDPAQGRIGQADERPATTVRPGEVVRSERLAAEPGQPFGERNNLDASHVESAIEFRVVVAPPALLRPWVEQRAAGRPGVGRRVPGEEAIQHLRRRRRSRPPRSPQGPRRRDRFGAGRWAGNLRDGGSGRPATSRPSQGGTGW